MSYKNRFSLNISGPFRILFCGFEYLERVQNVTIDGNIVNAKIYGTHPYDVSFAIDFKNRKAMYATCTCPYINEHRTCKHIAALMLYVDLYINGGSFKELCVYHIANIIVDKLKQLNKSLKIVKQDDIRKEIVGKNLNYLDFKSKYATGYFELLNDVSESLYEEAVKLLIKKEVLTIDKDNTVWTNKRLSKNYSDAYFDFYAKYSLLKGYGAYIDDPFDDDENYDEDEEYYYGRDIKEKHKGINMLSHGCLFRKGKLNETIFYDLKTDEIFFEDELFNHNSFMHFETFDVSSTFIEFFISTESNYEDKEELHKQYENGTFSFENLSSKQRARYRKLEENYFIGKGVQYCIENHYDFCFCDYFDYRRY